MIWPLEIVGELILASQSSARRELLEAQGILVHTRPTHTMKPAWRVTRYCFLSFLRRGR